MARRKANKLNDSVNVPVTRQLKRRLEDVARRKDGQPAPTKLARSYIEAGIQRDEQGVPEAEPATA